MFLIGLLILLLPPLLVEKPAEKGCAVAGQWYIDEARSPGEGKGHSLWTIKVTKERVDWIRESTREGVNPVVYIYPVGRSQGRFRGGAGWTREVEFSENRLIIRERLVSQQTLAEDLNLYEFEVKDHGYTLYYKHTYLRDVAVREQVLYLRPLPKKKK